MPKVLDLNPAQGTEKLLILAIIFDFFQVFKKQKLSNRLFEFFSHTGLWMKMLETWVF